MPPPSLPSFSSAAARERKPTPKALEAKATATPVHAAPTSWGSGINHKAARPRAAVAAALSEDDEEEIDAAEAAATPVHAAPVSRGSGISHRAAKPRAAVAAAPSEDKEEELDAAAAKRAKLMHRAEVQSLGLYI